MTEKEIFNAALNKDKPMYIDEDEARIFSAFKEVVLALYNGEIPCCQRVPMWTSELLLEHLNRNVD